MLTAEIKLRAKGKSKEGKGEERAEFNRDGNEVSRVSFGQPSHGGVTARLNRHLASLFRTRIGTRQSEESFKQIIFRHSDSFANCQDQQHVPRDVANRLQLDEICLSVPLET